MAAVIGCRTCERSISTHMAFNARLGRGNTEAKLHRLLFVSCGKNGKNSSRRECDLKTLCFLGRRGAFRSRVWMLLSAGLPEQSSAPSAGRYFLQAP